MAEVTKTKYVTRRINGNIEKVKIVIEENGIITRDGFYDILFARNVSGIANALGDQLYEMVRDREYSYETFWEIATGATKLKILANEGNEKVVLELKEFLANMRAETDDKLFRRMGQADSKFKEFVINELFERKKKGEYISDQEYRKVKKEALATIDLLLKKSWGFIKNVSQNTNAKLDVYTADELDELYGLACLYDTIVRHTPNKEKTVGKVRYLRPADAIYADKFLELSRSVIRAEIEKLENSSLSYAKIGRVVEELLSAMEDTDTKYGIKEAFDKEEISKILLKAPSILYASNAEKFTAVRECLVGYIEEVTKLVGKDKDGIKKLGSVTAKSIISRCASILLYSPQTIYESTNLLLGKPYSQIYSELKNSKYEKQNINAREILNTEFPALRFININKDDHIRIVTRNADLFKISSSTVLSINLFLMDSIILAYNPDTDVKKMKIDNKKAILRRLGIDYNTFFTGSNIGILFRSDVKTALSGHKNADFIESLRLLSKYLQPKTLTDVIRNNVEILVQEKDFLKNRINEILALHPDTNSVDFQDEFTLMLNEKYKIKIGKLNQITKGKTTKDSLGIAIDEKPVSRQKDTTDTADVRQWIDATFIGTNANDVALTQEQKSDEEKYYEISKELDDLYKLCDELAQYNKGSLNNFYSNLTTTLARKVATSFVNYDSNIYPKITILKDLKDLKAEIESIQDQDLKTSIKSELLSVIKQIKKIINGKFEQGLAGIASLTERMTELESYANSFYQADVTRGKRQGDMAFNSVLDAYNKALESLRFVEKILGKNTNSESVKAVNREKRLVVEQIERNKKLNKIHKQDRQFVAELEREIAVIKEGISILSLIQLFLRDEIVANIQDELTLLYKPVINENDKTKHTSKSTTSAIKKSDLQKDDEVEYINEEITRKRNEIAEIKNSLPKKIFDAVCEKYKSKKELNKILDQFENGNPNIEMVKKLVKIVRSLDELHSQIDELKTKKVDDTGSTNKKQ